jgi:hypothetical protein
VSGLLCPPPSLNRGALADLLHEVHPSEAGKRATLDWDELLRGAGLCVVVVFRRKSRAMVGVDPRAGSGVHA